MIPECHPACRQISSGICQRPFQLLAVLLLLSFGIGARAQAPTPDDTALRNQALLLYKQNNFTEALPLLEKLDAAHPNDIIILECLGTALLANAASSPDPEVRKQARLRARGIFLHAKELGDKSDYLATMLEQLPESGEMTPFSDRKEVDDAMREGEAAFSRSDFPGAIAAYQRAWQIDPKTYDAALYTGDVYYKMNQMDKAGDWFSKAIAVDPDRETAYRYWGDALLKEGKMAEAKAKYIEAILCQPYQRTPWNGLHNWVIANHAVISHPQIDTPDAVSGEGKQINITIGANSLGKNDGSEAWLVYDITRASWRGDKFKAKFPNEKAYRHSLAEEVDALNVAASVLEEKYSKPKQRKKLQPSLLTLLELHQKGMIEPFVLLSKPDAGIAQDYVAYRTEHRENLRAYINDWLIKPEPDKN